MPEEAEEEGAKQGGQAVQQQQQQQKGKGGGRGGGGKATKSAKGLVVGEPAPEFCLPNEEGQMVSLKDFKGKYVALYFFNKAMTPIVSKGGMAFAKVVPEMEKMGVPLLFIGPDR